MEKKCKYCQSEIDGKAKICPKCGKKQGNFFQKHPILTVFVALILLVAIVGGSDTDSSSEVTTKKQNKNETIYNVGDVIKTKKYEIIVTNVNTTEEVGGEFLKKQPSEGGIYVCVDFTYKNISDSPISSFSFPSLKLVDSKGVKYSNDIEASSYYATEKDPDRKILSDLNPGITVTDNKVFEISKDQYESGSWTITVDDNIKIKLK